MQLEDLNIALRPRRPWEAIDLGVSMVQRWRAAVFAAWFAVSLPCFLLINLIVADPFWSVALMWWLKPLFDSPLLFVLSRALFGATPTLRETLRAAPQWLWRSGLIWHLTLGRLDFARSFRLPVMQLEGSRGKQRRVLPRPAPKLHRHAGRMLRQGAAAADVERAVRLRGLPQRVAGSGACQQMCRAVNMLPPRLLAVSARPRPCCLPWTLGGGGGGGGGGG